MAGAPSLASRHRGPVRKTYIRNARPKRAHDACLPDRRAINLGHTIKAKCKPQSDPPSSEPGGRMPVGRRSTLRTGALYGSQVRRTSEVLANVTIPPARHAKGVPLTTRPHLRCDGTGMRSPGGAARLVPGGAGIGRVIRKGAHLIALSVDTDPRILSRTRNAAEKAAKRGANETRTVPTAGFETLTQYPFSPSSTSYLWTSP